MTASTAVFTKDPQVLRFAEESNLTELQLLYWIGHRLRPSAAHFNNAFSFTFSVSLDPELFQEAFATAVHQYDALRTVFQEHRGIPQQHVLPQPPAQLIFVDFSHEPAPQAAAEKWQQQRVQRPFQLNRCLYDSALLKLADRQFVWFLNQHHLITDASSFFLIAETVLQAYTALRRGEALAWTERPAFARYVATVQQQQSSSRAAKSRAFWQEKLHQRPEPLRFYGRSPQKSSGTVQRWTHNLGPKQTAQLKALAESVDLGVGAATTELRQFCLTATLLFSLLHQLTGNTQLGFVTTIHNRGTQVNRQTVGVLMELCPVLVTIAPYETFVSLLQKVAAEMKQLLLHYRHGASQAASDLALEVMFTFVQRPSLTLDEETVTHKIVHPGCGSERLGLHVHHLADSDSYELYLDLHQDSFNAAEQEHAKLSLQRLIATLLYNPNAPITTATIPWPHTVVKEVARANGCGNCRTRPEYAPPTTHIETQLQQIWQEVLGQSPIGVQDDFFALGGESWQAMSFLGRFEAATGYYLPLGTLLRHSTIASLAQQIETPGQPQAIVQIQQGASETLPLFLIPGAAGNTLAMDRLARHMAPHQPIYTFEIPLLDSKNLPPAEVETLAIYYLEAMQTVQPEGPYHLGGYSAGGILAYEVAQKLRAQGEKVDFLGIIDMPAPGLRYRSWQRFCRAVGLLLRLSATKEEALYLLGRDWGNRAIYFAVRGIKVWLWRFGRMLERFWQMPLKQKWLRLRRAMRRERELAPASRPPQRHDMDASSLEDPRTRALFDLYDRAVRKYLPQPYDGRLILLRCPLGYGRKEVRSPYPHYGWQPLVRHLETYTINARGHLALLQEPAVATVGQILQNVLSESIKTNKEEVA
ncbi:MAG: hypothetical protein CL608_13930 [Anaerolineaceae bacterium]|nr:hypothetical protein [Anaerolineaceae bacterium]